MIMNIVKKDRRKCSIQRRIEQANEQILEMRMYIKVLKKVLIETRDKQNSEELSKNIN